MSEPEKDTWERWSKHTIHALERLEKQIEGLRLDLTKANVDITRLGYFAAALDEVNSKMSAMRQALASQSDDVREAVASLERDDADIIRRHDERAAKTESKLEELGEFMSRTKTLAWVIGSIVAAVVGMFSMSLKDLLK